MTDLATYHDLVQAELRDGHIWLTASYRRKDQCKLVPGSRYDADRQAWGVPLSWGSCKALRGVFGQDLIVGPELVSWATAEVNLRITPCLALRSAVEAEGDPALYPFQRAGVQFLRTAEQALLADEMGTGKTVQVAVALRELRDAGECPFPALVVCPNSVKTNWRRELEKWCPEATIAVLSGSAANRRKLLAAGADVYILNWEATWRLSRLSGYGNLRLADGEKVDKELNAVPWRTVVADEAHRAKEPKAKQTRAVWHVAHQSTVRFRWALTGTPVANAPDDLWSILHMIDPRGWPARTRFVERYCLTAWNPYGGLDVVGVRPETREEFYAVLDPRMRRMPKDLVLPHLPPKLRSVREAEMTSKQAKAYKQMDEGMIAAIGDDDSGDYVVAPSPLTRSLRLSQFASAYAELNEAGEVRLQAPSNKVEALLEILEELGDEPLVVFAESRQLVELASERLMKERISHRLLVGGLTDDQRAAAVSDFQEGRARVILLTLKAGGEGITLTRAWHICFLQRSWSMIDNRQAEDRVHRIGSEIHDVIHVIDVIAPGTVEDDQIETLHAKFARLQEIVRDRETLRIAAAAGDHVAAQKLAQLEGEENAIMQSNLAMEVVA